MSVIRRQDALRLIREKGNPFTLEYVMYSESRGTGGQIKRLVNCEVVGAAQDLSENMMINIRQVGVPNDHPHPVYIYLIIKYNDMRVV
jgi:hypothetical protein